MSRHGNPRAIALAAVLFVALPFAHAEGQTRQAQAQPSSAAPHAKAPGKDPQALAALKDMSTTLASAKTMSFKVRTLRPMKLASGAWITLIGAASVKREGKDKLSVETSGDYFPFHFYFDGKTVTAFASEKKIYAQKDAPGTIDEVLDQAAKNGTVTFIFADIVGSDPYAAMTKGLQSAFVVGASTIDGVETEHVAVHGKMMDWEVWIGMKDRLPRLVTLTDTSQARKPSHALQFSEWALDQSLPGDAFSFNAPADAIKVPFRNPGQMVTGRRAPAQRP